MKNENKQTNIEYALKNLERVDKWIANCDTKSSIMLTILCVFLGLTSNIFKIISIIFDYFSNWQTNLISENLYAIFLIVIFIIFVANVILSFTYLVKSLTASINNNYQSFLHFYSINKNFKDIKSFNSEWEKLTDKKLLEQINEQVYTNSKICSNKFLFYKKSILWIVLSFIFGIICLILVNV